MKKLFLIILTILSFGVLSGCKKEEIKVIVPAGAPALAQVYIENDPNLRLKELSIDRVDGADPLVAAFTSGSHDIIFAPINLGVKMYNAGMDYVFLGTVVFGNYYFATTGNEELTLESLSNRKIVLFGKNQVAGIMAEYILNANNLLNMENIIYVNSVSEAQAELVKDNSVVILTAEPSLSVLRTKVANVKSVSLLDEYGNTKYPQAGVFVKKDLSKNILTQYEIKLKDSINKLNNSKEEMAEIAVNLGYGFPKQALINAIPNANISFSKARNQKAELEAFLNILMGVNPNLIGGKLPDDGFYYGLDE